MNRKRQTSPEALERLVGGCQDQRTGRSLFCEVAVGIEVVRSWFIGRDVEFGVDLCVTSTRNTTQRSVGF